MVRRSCDGDGLLAALREAVANLEAHVDEVNALNVYPVPDGDTGSNMLATVRAALDEAATVTGGGADRIAAAISFGALMGARGNSGVILSQIVRGMSEGLEGRRRFNGLDLAHALSVGSATAYRAVARPVEGTILTVIREAAAAAIERGEHENDVQAVLTAAVEAAAKAVAKTPSLLPILHEAGVVDAGGQGLFRLLDGALRSLVSVTAAGPRQADDHAPDRASEGRPSRPSALVPHADAGYGYETMFLLQAAGRPLDQDAIRVHLESIGESVLVAGDSRALKVHVHSPRPDEVIAYGLSVGALSRISVENLDEQTAGVADEAAANLAVEGSGTKREADDGGPATGSGATARPSLGDREGSAGDGRRNGRVHVPLAVVAVAPGEGLAAVFESFGVSAIVAGGQANNPSTGELLAAVQELDADQVLLLPNNPNVLLAANQVRDLTDRPVGVVPTRNAAEGIAALLAMDPTLGAEGNVRVMTEAGRGIQTIQVTEAVRDATVDGHKVKKGQTIVLGPDDGLVAADGDRDRAIVRALEGFRPGFELITIYYGDGADLAEAEAVARRITEWHPGIETEVVHGGQPHYRYLISAE